MKIRVEHESARKLSLENHLHDSCLVDEVVLSFSVESQLQSNWCWAAIASSIGLFYGTACLAQEEVVRRVLKIPGASLVEKNSNQQITLDKSLKLVNCFSHWSLGWPSFERLLLEISAGRLPCARIEWLKGGAHYLVIKGITPEKQLLHIEDSLHGPSVEAYQKFPKHYQDTGAIWTETYWTAPPSSTPSSRDKDDEQL